MKRFHTKKAAVRELKVFKRVNGTSFNAPSMDHATPWNSTFYRMKHLLESTLA